MRVTPRTTFESRTRTPTSMRSTKVSGGSRPPSRRRWSYLSNPDDPDATDWLYSSLLSHAPGVRHAHVGHARFDCILPEYQPAAEWCIAFARAATGFDWRCRGR